MADKKSSSGSENSDSHHSSRSGGSEEERLRRLFNSCDADGDGFLDGEDFTFMCRMLNLEDSVNEIRFQLGMTDQSRISFDDFLRCRDHVMLETTLHSGGVGGGGGPISPAAGSGGPMLVVSGGEDTGVDSDASGMMGNNNNGAPIQQLTSWPTLSSDSLGALSYSKPESADYDSGARDLSPEPTTLTLLQLMEVHDPQAFQRMTNAGLESCLDIADRLHVAAMTSMKGEILEMKHHIHRLSVGEREDIRKSQGEDSLEKVMEPDFEQRLEQLTSRYEERIIELHSVIAELRKKVERHQINVIREEDEFEESDMTPSIQSNDGESLTGRDENNEISMEFSRVVSQIETDLAGKGDLATLPQQGEAGKADNDDADNMAVKLQAVKVGTDEETAMKLKNSFEVKKGGDTTIPNNCHKQDDVMSSNPQPTQNTDVDRPPDLPPRPPRPRSMTPEIGLRSEVVEGREVRENRELRADNDELRRQTSQLEVELGEMAGRMDGLEDERTGLKKKVLELQHRLQAQSQALPRSPSQSRVTTPTKQTPPTASRSDRRSAEPASYPVAKVAELKKLKTCISDMQGLGSEVTALGIQSTPTAEHLAQSFHEGSNAAELMHLKTPSLLGDGSGSSGGGGGGGGGGHLSMAKEFQVELELRQAKVDHLKAQNDVISATLEESKSEAERLSVLMGGLESNHTALQLAYSISDNCMEAQDVLVALLESEMGVLLASCRAAGLGGLATSGDPDEDSDEVASILQRAHHARRKSESVARHLLSRLERTCGVLGGGGGGCGGGVVGQAPNQAWEDVSTTSRTHSSSSSTNSSADSPEFSKVEETRLREYIQQLKVDRLSVRRTVLELESVHTDRAISEPRQQVEAQRLDLENAVLVQELMAVKEEKAELKAKSYLLEKEKRALELRLSGKETQEQAFRVQIDFLKGEVDYQQQLQQQQQQQQYAHYNHHDRQHHHHHRHHHHRTSISSSSSSSSTSSSTANLFSNCSNSNSNNNNNNNIGDSSNINNNNNNDNNALTGYPDTNLIAAELQFYQQNQNPSELIRNLTLSREREHTLKGRVSELMATLEKISRNSESRHKQSADFVNDLKRANTALISAFDKAKKKYQGRLKKMEQQLKGLKEQYDMETSSLRHRIGLLEGKGGVRVVRPAPDETSL